MLFNSLEFLIFLPIVFSLYWFTFRNNLKVQNLLLLISSYIFYGWWDWRFLSLIFLSTIVDYFVGLKIHSSRHNKLKKTYLWISVLFNLSLLGFFKYFNFFIESWIDLLNVFGYDQANTWTLNVILPVGISFYTFQTMSYSLDIYYKKLRPTKDFLSFASFVSFFPQLVAGPIERASKLLPQFRKPRVYNIDHLISATSLILLGLFKKVVVADNLAGWVDTIFSNYTDKPVFTLLFGAVFFSFQIYCDFSGYSTIALGVAKLLGFQLTQNFKKPYLSINIKEFWSRWHISLSSWFRDYLYIPLGGSRKNTFFSIRNILVTFIVSGFWHGANWTFILWGFYHSILYVPHILIKNNKTKDTKEKIYKFNDSNIFIKFFKIVFTYITVLFGWVIFRSDSIFDATAYFKNILFNDMFPNSTVELFIGLGPFQFLFNIFLIILVFFTYLIPSDCSFKNKFNNLILNVVFFLLIILLGSYKNVSFIYFQF